MEVTYTDSTIHYNTYLDSGGFKYPTMDEVAQKVKTLGDTKMSSLKGLERLMRIRVLQQQLKEIRDD